MKYVMFTCTKTLRRLPVLFSDHTTHSEVSLPGHVATSAGFFNMDNLKTYGESQSLRLKPDEGDEFLIGALLSGVFESTWALLQDFDENARRLEDFCDCGHLRVAHRFIVAEDLCRCAVSGCKCEASELPKKMERKC